MFIDHLIIGGGISGSYIAHQLNKKRQSFLVLEKDLIDRGKQYTINYTVDSQVVHIELGSSVIHSKQETILELLKELNLHTTPLPKNEKAVYIYPGYTFDQAKEKYKALRKKLKESVLQYPSYFTVEDLAKKIFNDNEYIFFKWCMDAWYEYNDQNAITYFDSVKNEGDYLYISEGMEYMLKKISLPFLDKIRFNTEVKSVEKNGEEYLVRTDKDLYNTKKLYICVNLGSAKKIEYINLENVSRYLNLGLSKECLRVYVVLNKRLDIEYGSISGKFLSKWTLRITDKVWMVTYTDGTLAKKLENMEIKELIRTWINDMNNLFNKDLTFNDVVYYVSGYWDDAYAVLSKEFYKGNKVKLPDNLMITSLPKGKGENTAWIEGHLYKI
jgi:hypothetical protein